MSPGETTALFTFLSDAVKILGPAALAAFMGYRVAKSQADTELLKVRAEHIYRARSEIFTLHKASLDQVHATMKQVSESIGQIVGFLSGLRPADGEGPLPALALFAVSYSRRVPGEVEVLEQRLKDVRLGERAELRTLRTAVQRIPDWTAPIEPTIRDVTERLMALEHVHVSLQGCHALLIERELTEALSSYIETSKS